MTAFPMTFQSGGSDHDVEVLGDNIEAQASKKLDLGLKKLDRPFQNLTPTAMLPMNYASIFQAQVEPQEKARRLRRALRRDNLQLLAFMLLVAFLGSLAFFVGHTFLRLHDPRGTFHPFLVILRGFSYFPIFSSALLPPLMHCID